jgi:hypothetical protein
MVRAPREVGRYATAAPSLGATTAKAVSAWVVADRRLERDQALAGPVGRGALSRDGAVVYRAASLAHRGRHRVRVAVGRDVDKRSCLLGRTRSSDESILEFRSLLA